MSDADFARSLLQELLAVHSPELGARLKQHMQAEFLRSGREPFDHRVWGYPKFVDYLEANHNVVRLDRPDGPGDVRVSLRYPKVSPSHERTERLPDKPGTGERLPLIRNDIWQAFTNPDPARRRFFSRSTSRIRHFLVGEPGHPAEETVPRDHVEVPFISGDEHLTWMKEYLAELALEEHERTPLERLLQGTYSSRLNTTFTSALGDHSTGWRRRRTRLVFERIAQWAKECGVELSTLELPPRTPPAEPAAHMPRGSLGAVKSRERLNLLLDLLTDADIDNIVLPLVLSVLWTSTRRGG